MFIKYCATLCLLFSATISKADTLEIVDIQVIDKFSEKVLKTVHGRCVATGYTTSYIVIQCKVSNKEYKPVFYSRFGIYLSVKRYRKEPVSSDSYPFYVKVGDN